MTLLDLVIAILASLRVTHMVTREDGPGNVFLNLRGWVVNRYGEGSWQAEGIDCPECVSVWTSALAVLLSHTGTGRKLLAALAISQVVVNIATENEREL